MKHYVNVQSVAFRLVLFTLIISIIPVSVIVYTTSMAIGSMKNNQFNDNLASLEIISDQAYTARVDSDNALVQMMAGDSSLETAIRDNESLTMKRIIDRYANANPNISLLEVTDSDGTVIASSAFVNSSDRPTGVFVESALAGRGLAGTDVVPARILKNNYIEYKTVSSGTPNGLGIICAQPVKDDEGKVIGTVYLIELLNENTDLVDKIAGAARGECTIYMGDVRVATSMKNAYGVRILGTRADEGVVTDLLSSNNSGSYRGYEDLNGQHIYTNFKPLRNPEGQIVGMIAAGYDVNPSMAEINSLAYYSLATGLIIAVLSSLIGFLLVREIMRPIHKLVKAAKKVASGDLDTPLENRLEDDEISELLSAIRKMVDSIKERIYYSESIVQSISDPMLVIDREDRINFINRPASDLTGFSLHEAVGKKYTEVFSVVPLDGASIYEHLHKRRIIRSFEGGVVGSDGRKKIVRGSCAPIMAANGTVTGTIVLLRDVTLEKEASDHIKASLKEKEVLLKEIHHRVKNNLQIISSLLSLQSAYVKDSAALSMFRDSQDRVRSMALIHERLYQTDNLSRVDFGEYLRKLSGSLAQSYNLNPQKVRLTIDADHARLGVDTAIPCGLIVNELLSNAFKYAFPGGRSGEIRILLDKAGPGDQSQYRLTVADDGIGLPADLNIEETETLGLQLVTILTEQLDGKLTVSRNEGTEFTITFTEVKIQGMMSGVA